MTSGIKRTREEIEKIVGKLGYELSDEYMERKKRRVVIQDEWGYRYDVDFRGLKTGKIPNFIDVGNPNTLRNISLWLQREEKAFELCNENKYNGKGEKLWFHCLVPTCNENFDMSWDNIYSGMQGCPFCSGRRVSDKNRLCVIRPDISSEWDYKLNEDTPNEVSYGSNKKKYWICPNGHPSYPAIISSRTKINGGGCPRCSGNVVSDGTKLSIMRPDIAIEWDNELNEDTSDDVTYASGKSKFWKCPKGHESYRATIHNRTNGGTGCPICADDRKESKIATELKQWCKDTFGPENADSEHKMFKHSDSGRWLRCDIYLGKEKTIDGVYIEVHGPQHYKISGFHYLQAKLKKTKAEEEFKYSRSLDKIKKKYARKNGAYIEIDLRKIKTTEQAVEHIINILN